jgi:hypothetical protein
MSSKRRARQGDIIVGEVGFAGDADDWHDDVVDQRVDDLAALRALGGLSRQEGAELFGEVEQDRAGLEDADRLAPAAIHHGRDLGIGIDGDEAAAELVAVVNPDQPSVVFGALLAERQRSSSMMVTFWPFGVASE